MTVGKKKNNNDKFLETGERKKTPDRGSQKDQDPQQTVDTVLLQTLTSKSEKEFEVLLKTLSEAKDHAFVLEVLQQIVDLLKKEPAEIKANAKRKVLRILVEAQKNQWLQERGYTRSSFLTTYSLEPLGASKAELDEISASLKIVLHWSALKMKEKEIGTYKLLPELNKEGITTQQLLEALQRIEKIMEPDDFKGLVEEFQKRQGGKSVFIPGGEIVTQTLLNDLTQTTDSESNRPAYKFQFGSDYHISIQGIQETIRSFTPKEVELDIGVHSSGNIRYVGLTGVDSEGNIQRINMPIGDKEYREIISQDHLTPQALADMLRTQLEQSGYTVKSISGFSPHDIWGGPLRRKFDSVFSRASVTGRAGRMGSYFYNNIKKERKGAGYPDDFIDPARGDEYLRQQVRHLDEEVLSLW